MLIAAALTILLVVAACGVAVARRRRRVAMNDARAAALSSLTMEGMLVLDERDRVAWVSDHALRILGARRDALIDQRLDEITDPELRRLLGRVDLTMSRGREDDVVVERARDGRTSQHLCLGGAELHDEQGRYIGAAVWVQDITDRIHADRRLEASEARYRRLVETAHEIIWSCDEQLRMTFVNGAIEEVLGFTTEESIGQPLLATVPDEHREAAQEAVRRVLAGVPRLELETVMRRADGVDIDVAVDLVPLVEREQIVGVSGISRDITAYRMAEAERERASARAGAIAELGRRALQLAEPAAFMTEAARTLASVLELGCGLVLEYDRDTRDLRVVAEVSATPELRSLCEVHAPEDHDGHLGFALRVGTVATLPGADRRQTEDEEAFRTFGLRSGLAIPVQVRGRTFGLLAGYTRDARRFDPAEIAFAESVANVVGSAVERLQVERADRERALTDQLTGLPNRALFMDRLRGAVARARRSGDHVAVFMVGVDGFKTINDGLGRSAGDDLLATIAQRLRTEVRAADTVARLGGDEFVVLCETLGGERDAVAIAATLSELWREPFVLDAGEVYTTGSIGVAVAEAGAAGADDLLRDADAAMQRAKRRGRGRFELFDEELRARVGERMQLELDVHRALELQQFRVVYQPIVHLGTGTVSGAEALLRWDHPEWGAVSPMEFIPAAERTGDIVAIGEWVLREACTQVARWQERWPGFTLSVNVSGRQIADPSLPDRVAAIVAEAQLAPGTLGLEITESVLMESDVDPEVILARLRAAGARLLLDDFGTGYSSLSYLKRFPLDTLKVDRSFVDGLGEEDEDSAIVAAIVQLASTLDLTVVAEGVETAEQLDQLCMLDCDLAQGYLLSRPLDGEDLERLLGDASQPVLRVA